MTKKVFVAALFLIFCSAAICFADVTLPNVLADHMVIQRGLPVHIWGSANPGEAVSVTFRNETKTATADNVGRWSVYLTPGEAGGPFTVAIKATNTITLSDVLVGDVWVASGQSNMELPMTRVDNSEAEIAAAKFPKIRIYWVNRATAEYPMEDTPAKTWTECSPQSVADSSAVAYYFARDIQARTGVPIGLIETFWGGSPAEAWTSLGALGADAALMPVFATRAKIVADQATVLRQNDDRYFLQAVEKAKAAGKTPPTKKWMDPYGWTPGSLFNAMISPFTPYAIRGVIWYQGETNGGKERAPLYAHLFQTLIRDWRRAWGEGDFPFLYVQLAGFRPAADGDWQTVRDAQRQTLSLRNTGMAVIFDISDPDNLHPTDKKDVGLRLALAARATTYGEKIEYSGPLVRQLTPEGGTLRIWFDHASGLNMKGAEVKGFEIAGSDGKFFPAQGKIDGFTVVISSPDVAAPVSARYGWSAAPDGNLFNREGLPASPFLAMK